MKQGQVIVVGLPEGGESPQVTVEDAEMTPGAFFSTITLKQGEDLGDSCSCNRCLKFHPAIIHCGPIP